MALKDEMIKLQRDRNLAQTARYICQNRYQREFFREYLEWQDREHLPNKATSFKKFIRYWTDQGKQVPYSKSYLKSKMMHLLKAIDDGAKLSESSN